jgi:hypothetical protein
MAGAAAEVLMVVVCVRRSALVALLVAAGCSSPAGDTRTATTRQALSRAPRIWLTAGVLQSLQMRAASGDATWTALQAHCDALTGGTFNPPSGDAYPTFPDVGQGYQGEAYLPEVLALGLCYQVAQGVDPGAAARYGSAGDRLLAAISTPPGSGGQAPSTDSGYGIRFYGVSMAVGYDWLYPALSGSTRSQVVSTLDAWIDWYDTSGFINSEPIGNYFVGYLLAKTTAAIALDGDDPNAAAYWSDVQSRMWGQLVKPSYTASMTGGGWPEGWEYGPLSVTEMVEFLWAAQTGKGVDWWSQLPQARDQAAYIGQFAWPSRMHMDDQGTIHAQAALRPPACAALALSGMLADQGDPYAPTARSLANELLASTGATCPEWQAFLFGDPSLPSTPSYTEQPLSYFAPGPNHVAARSSWQKDAVWATFVSGQYIDAPDSGEQYFNQGAVAVVQGDQPIIVNPTGWLPQVAGDSGEAFVYDDTWGSRTRLLDNSFYVAGAVQEGADPTQSSTHVEHYEDLSLVVHARGRQIEQQYTHGAVTQFTRDFAYVRPGTIVVYDRTTVPQDGTDQWLAWHTPSEPVAVATTDATQKRYDVQAGGATIGSIRALAPDGVTTKTTSLVGGAAWRLEVHAPRASQDWLTAITVGGQVPDEERLSPADGSVTSGAMLGVHVTGSPEQVVLFGADHAASAPVNGVRYTVAQKAQATHVLFDLAPSSSGWAVTATPSAGKLSIAVAPGGPGQASAAGTLVFDVETDGTVTFPSTGSGGPGGDGGVGGSSGGAAGSSGGGVAGGSSGAGGDTSGGAGGAGGAGSGGCSMAASGSGPAGAGSFLLGAVWLLRRRRRDGR